MADNLKTVLEKELSKLTHNRDAMRKQALAYKQYGDDLDKQVNRLQHFLADYDTAEPPDGEKPNKQMARQAGIQDAVIDSLKRAYPSGKTKREISEEIEDVGLNPRSVHSCLERLRVKGVATKFLDKGNLFYRLILPNETYFGKSNVKGNDK